MLFLRLILHRVSLQSIPEQNGSIKIENVISRYEFLTLLFSDDQ